VQRPMAVCIVIAIMRPLPCLAPPPPPQAQDTRRSGHFTYISVPEFSGAPPFRASNKLAVVEWLARIGAREMVAPAEVSLCAEWGGAKGDRGSCLLCCVGGSGASGALDCPVLPCGHGDGTCLVVMVMGHALWSYGDGTECWPQPLGLRGYAG
jgi:hypothetical protein